MAVAPPVLAVMAAARQLPLGWDSAWDSARPGDCWVGAQGFPVPGSLACGATMRVVAVITAPGVVDTLAVEGIPPVIAALQKAERLSGDFAERLLSWERSGFSVYAEQVVYPHERERLARLSRYVARAPLPFARVREGPDGRLLVRAGDREAAFAPLDLIHALVQQIPDKGQHLVRYYGAYANRARRLYANEGEAGGPGGRAPPPHGDEESVFAKARRKSWARLLRRILEVDPLLCPQCGAGMRIVSVITDHEVVDRILDHLAKHDAQARAPPDP